MTDNTPRSPTYNSFSPRKKVNPEHMLKSYKKEDHDEHAPDSVRDSEMHSEMVDLSHRKESELESFHKAEAHTAQKLLNPKIEDEPVDFGLFPETKGRVGNDFAPKDDQGDDDGDDHQRE